MVELFRNILYIPLFNGFVGLYNIVGDVGVVIFVITVFIKLVLYPLTSKSITAQKALTELQPKLEELKKKHKDDQQALAQETMKVYKDNKVNPLGSCLPILIQLPVFLALYWVLRDGLTTDTFDILYPFVAVPEFINPVTLGLFDLSRVSIVLALAAGAAQFWQAKMFSRKKSPKAAGEGGKDENMMSMMNKQMLYFMPGLTVIIGLQLPGGLALYWFLSTFITAIQQKVLFRKKKDGGSGSGSGDVLEGKIVS
jgi:YidC/Oxa1 family membrane protein insertase